MNHIVLNERGKPFKVGDEVMIINSDHPMHKKYGKICRVRNYYDEPRISVIFDESRHEGEVFACAPSDLKLY